MSGHAHRLGKLASQLRPSSPPPPKWRASPACAVHVEPAAAASSGPVVRVAIYGAGGHARRAHAPSLRALPGVEIVAIADANLELAAKLAEDFAPGARLYADGAAMLAAEELDALFSVVPARVRPEGVEAAAARKGVHLFSEKPQTLDMHTARAIADAVAAGGVVSSVGFRERYRPLFRAARSFLADKDVVHCAFRSYGGPPGKAAAGPSWWDDFELRGTSYVQAGTGAALPGQTYIGGGMLDWGCHAVDYMRYMTGQDIVGAQAWCECPSVALRSRQHPRSPACCITALSARL
jgi:predicted dehydrogenase